MSATTLFARFYRLSVGVLYAPTGENVFLLVYY